MLKIRTQKSISYTSTRSVKYISMFTNINFCEAIHKLHGLVLCQKTIVRIGQTPKSQTKSKKARNIAYRSELFVFGDCPILTRDTRMYVNCQILEIFIYIKTKVASNNSLVSPSLTTYHRAPLHTELCKLTYALIYSNIIST